MNQFSFAVERTAKEKVSVPLKRYGKSCRLMLPLDECQIEGKFLYPAGLSLFAFRPLSRKQKITESLCSLRLCGK
jgi:hypothetical protein